LELPRTARPLWSLPSFNPPGGSGSLGT